MLISEVQLINHLITDLPALERNRLLAECELVDLVFAEILTEPNEAMQYAWFPNQGFISLTVPVDKSSNLEVGLIGNEGMLGNTLVLGVTIAPLHSLVQGAGQALRIPVANLLQQIKQSPILEAMLKKYLYVTLVQLSHYPGISCLHVGGASRRCYPSSHGIAQTAVNQISPRQYHHSGCERARGICLQLL